MNGVFADWVLPIALGAIIGYFTNWIAIKMLFRPLKEYRILGFRVPFTPGILPRGRARLAKSLGDVVSDELLTPDLLSRRLGDPELVEKSSEMVGNMIGDILDTRIESLVPSLLGRDELQALGAGDTDVSGDTVGAAPSAVPASGTRDSPPIAAILMNSFRGFLESPVFAKAFDDALEVAFKVLREIRLSAFIAPETVAEMVEAGLTDDMIARVITATRVSAYERLEASREAGGTIGELLPCDGIRDAIEPIVDSLMPYITNVLERVIGNKDVREAIEKKTEDAIMMTVSKLNAFQRLLVSATRYDRDIINSVPGTVDSMAKNIMGEVRTDAFRKKLTATLSAEFETLVSRKTVEVLGEPEQAANALESILRASLLDKSIGKALGRSLAELLRENANATFGDLFDLFGKGEGFRAVNDRIRQSVVGIAGTGSASGVVSALVSRFFASIGGMRIGDIILLETEDRSRLAGAIAVSVLGFVSREAPRILEGIDVRSIVVEKVDSMDMLAVENILLQVMSSELKWVTWLGGVLGAVIGAVQGVISLF